VLFYGFIGVLVLRAIMIGAGAVIVAHFEWALIVFAAFLVVTGLRMLFPGAHEYDVEANPVLHFLRRYLRVTADLRGERFFVRQQDADTGRAALHATPLFLALVMIELADIVFAVDSIPAIFMITTDPYVIYTSNIFALLGLRALFFSLSALMQRFEHLTTALALVLIFIGGKVIASDLAGIDKLPASVSLSITLLILSGGVLASCGTGRRITGRLRSLGTRNRTKRS
jgi:tellurite resistance protein TerC